ncbi:MAG: ankyrin repeat domain-containing protein, partial [Novosphingobium sp.]|nr:ankyrin repeat domain-containing protein [Novosphingobium sp.]
ESLITLEADVNAKQSDGYTPLMLVSRMKLDSSKPSITMYSQSLSHIVDLLIKNNADVNVKDDNGNTALIHSVNCNNKIVLDKLLRDINDKAIDINLENKEKQTALMRSVMNNNIDIFKSLIKHDASLNIKNKDGKNLLMLAIEYKCTSDSQDVKDNYDIIENIIKLGVIDLNDKDNNSVTVEDMARKSGKKNVIDLISSNSSKGSCIVS